MKTKHISHTNSLQLAELRRRERQVACEPSAESYLELADRYHALGLQKESDRLVQLAEALEQGDANLGPAEGLLSGTASPVMLAEVIQILSRTKASGDFVIDAEAQVFHLHFDRGQIINASSQHHLEGVESFRMAMRVPFGTYRFYQKSPGEIAHLIQESTEMLLLEAMHEADTAAAQGADL